MHAICLQMSIRCWGARRRLKQRRKEHFSLMDGLSRQCAHAYLSLGCSCSVVATLRVRVAYLDANPHDGVRPRAFINLHDARHLTQPSAA
jgi:hypothetical protein